MSGVVGDLLAFVVWWWAAVGNQSRAPLRLAVAFDYEALRLSLEALRLSLKALDLDLCERRELNK